MSEELENKTSEEESSEGGYGNGLFEHHRVTATDGQALMRVDQYLTHHIRNSTRSKIKKAAQNNCITVNGEPVKASYKVKPGDEVSVYLPYPPPPELVPEYVPLNILYEDEDILILNKQAGLVVHPGVGNHHGTMVHGLLYYFNGPDISNIPEDLLINPGLVHRIDKDTTGLLVIAKTEEAMFKVANQFYNKTTKRNYYAIVWRDVKEDKGRIETFLGRHPKDRTKYAVTTDEEKGKRAVTHYEVLERFGLATLVKCTLETGRTHQIRVHMQHIGHPLFGDPKYGGDVVITGPTNSKKFRALILNCLNTMKRQALHAQNLGFIHPKTGNEVSFESDLPEDFVKLLSLLQKYVKEENEKFKPFSEEEE